MLKRFFKFISFKQLRLEITVDVEDLSAGETVINVENQRPKRAWEQWSDEDQVTII